MEISLFKSLYTDSFALGPSRKAAVWKMPRPYVKKIYLLILKHLLEGQEPIRTFSGDTGTVGHPFCFSFYLASIGLADTFFALSLWPVSNRGHVWHLRLSLGPSQSWPSKYLSPTTSAAPAKPVGWVPCTCAIPTVSPNLTGQIHCPCITPVAPPKPADTCSP